MNPESIERETIPAIIEVGLHELNMQGRPGYKSGVRPNHWIPGRDYPFIGQIDFDEPELLKPGDSCIASSNLYIVSQDRELFVPGFTWHICEGIKIVGYAKIIEIKST